MKTEGEDYLPKLPLKRELPPWKLWGSNTLITSEERASTMETEGDD